MAAVQSGPGHMAIGMGGSGSGGDSDDGRRRGQPSKSGGTGKVNTPNVQVYDIEWLREFSRLHTSVN